MNRSKDSTGGDGHLSLIMADVSDFERSRRTWWGDLGFGSQKRHMVVSDERRVWLEKTSAPPISDDGHPRYLKIASRSTSSHTCGRDPGEKGDGRRESSLMPDILKAPPEWLLRRRTGFIVSTILFAIVTVVLRPFVGDTNIVHVVSLFLLVTVMSAALWGYVVGLVAALVANLCVNFFFTEPRHTFIVDDPGTVLALVTFLAVALTGAFMLGLIRRQVLATEAKGAEAAILLNLSREITASASPAEALERICVAATGVFEAEACQIMQYREPSTSPGVPTHELNGGNGWRVVASHPSTASHVPVSRDEESILRSVLSSSSTISYSVEAGNHAGGQGPPARTQAVFAPITTGRANAGVLKITGKIRLPPMVDSSHVLSAFCYEASRAVQRAELAEAAAQARALQEADNLKAVILSSISHDLRSPLTAIKTSIGSLRDPSIKLESGDVEEFLDIISSQTDRLASTVDNLLQLNRLESGSVKLMIEPLYVDDLLQDVVSLSGKVTEGRTVSVAVVEEIGILADHALLVQALGNLVENAAKHSKPGGAIRLAATRFENRARLSVADDGPGMPASELPHIFGRFYKGSASRARGGVGLGLAIVKSMVELCGGTIAVESFEHGTTFTLEFAQALEIESDARIPHPAH